MLRVSGRHEELDSIGGAAAGTSAWQGGTEDCDDDIVVVGAGVATKRLQVC